MSVYSVGNFIKNLDNLKTGNLFVFHGAEYFFIDYLIEQVSAVTFVNSSDKDLNFHKFYGTEDTLSEILSACMSYPMLSDRKLVIVKEFDKLKTTKNEAESLQKYIKNPQPTTVLVLTGGKLDGTKLNRQLINAGSSVECKNLRSNEIFSWLKEKFQRANIEIENDAINFLLENIGNDLLRLSQEIDKSINFLGEGKKLSIELLSDLTGFNREVNIFNFQKVLGLRKLNESLKIGLQLLEQQSSLEVILAMLFRFFIRVMVIKQQQNKSVSKSNIIKKLNEKEFMLADAFASVNNFSLQEITYIMNKLEEADVSLKTSSGKKESILTMLCYYICTPDIKNLN